MSRTLDGSSLIRTTRLISTEDFDDEIEDQPNPDGTEGGDGSNTVVIEDDDTVSSWSLQTVYEEVPIGWWTEAGIPYALTYNEDREVITNFKGPVYRKDAWDTALEITGQMNQADLEIYKNYLTRFIDMVDDCDIDCQSKGSQLTFVAFLLAISYAIVFLNSLAMLLGSVRAFWRTLTIYLSLGACVGQVVI